MLKKLIGPLALISAIVIVYSLIKNKPRPTSAAENTAVNITLPVTTVKPTSHSIMIPVEGFVNSRWQTTLSSQVSGKVRSIDDKFLVGNRFKQGDVLIRLEAIDYEVQVSRAEANHKAAEANLIEQQMQSERAKSDWNKLNPNRAPSDFNLRIPQLRNAESNLKAAQAELKLAQRNLQRTTIKAPFDGFTLSRNVDIGEVVQVGGLLGDVVNNENLELRLSVNTQQAELIESAKDIELLVQKENTILSYQEIRFEPFIDNNNRWRSFNVVLNPENNDRLIGEFLQLNIKANVQQLLLALPESALSIDGRIWYVNNEGQTAFFKPELTYKNGGQLFLQPNDELDFPIDVIVSPSNSLLAGITVNKDIYQPLTVTQ